MQDETKEKLVAVSFDARDKIISYEVIGIGSVDSVHARPFECLRGAIVVNASGIVLVHNHPSGDPTPSPDDRKFTKEIRELTEKGGMDLLDHVIIGHGRYYSFAEKGLL